MIEWSVLALVITMLALVFSYRMRLLQGQAELSAVKTTVGALRTAFVLDNLRTHAAEAPAADAPTHYNPFELLQQHPVNYIGEMTREQAELAPPGIWVFDPECICVGYLPIWPEWFDSPSGDLMAWYRVGGGPGALQLTPKEHYLWQGQVLD